MPIPTVLKAELKSTSRRLVAAGESELCEYVLDVFQEDPLKTHNYCGQCNGTVINWGHNDDHGQVQRQVKNV